MLEALAHEHSCFVTLTYGEETCPVDLVPSDLAQFLRKLRKMVAPRRVRYFAAGEYGAKNERPHFHLALFGISFQERALIEKAWGHGFVHTGFLSAKSASYVAKYITKRWIGDSGRDPRHGDRVAEFARMSLRPGIGAEGLEATVAALLSRGASAGVAAAGDVPGHVRLEGRRFPLGRYLRRRLRSDVGWAPEAPPEVQRAVRFKRSVEDTSKVQRQRKQSALSAERRVELADSKRRLA